MELIKMNCKSIIGLYCLLSLAVAGPAFASNCHPDFSLEHGQALSWQGADDAYSIRLADGRDVWIFGDTLYGAERLVVGNDPRMTHSSIGISTCDAKTGWHITYYIKRDATGKPASFFVPENPNHWYWAMDGFVARGSLWVTLMCVKPAETPQPWAMNFQTCGADLARISNPGDDPQNWKITYAHLVPDGMKAYPSATAFVEGKYAYIFSLYEAGTRPMILTRIALSGLNKAADHLEYLDADNTWKPGLVPAKAKEVMHQGTSEMSVRYHPDIKQWVAVLIDPVFLSDKIYMRTAPEFTGPWTDGSVIYHIPEMIAGPQHEKDTFCYAGKEHPEFEAGGEVLFTYVCNTFSVPKLMTEQNIYFPQVVSVPLPK
jgi:hypothetical protein